MPLSCQEVGTFDGTDVSISTLSFGTIITGLIPLKPTLSIPVVWAKKPSPPTRYIELYVVPFSPVQKVVLKSHSWFLLNVDEQPELPCPKTQPILSNSSTV